jgi:hypothetical protein
MGRKRMREALAAAAPSLPPGHWRRAEVESALGACLLRLGRPQEARPLLDGAYAALLFARGANHPATGLARHRLDSALSQAGGGGP